MGEDGRIKVAAARRARANGDDEADDEDEEDDDSPIGETTPRPHRRQRSSGDAPCAIPLDWARWRGR